MGRPSMSKVEITRWLMKNGHSCVAIASTGGSRNGERADLKTARNVMMRISFDAGVNGG